MACGRPRRCHAHTSFARIFSFGNVASETLQSSEQSQERKNTALSIPCLDASSLPIQVQPTFSSPSIELEDKVKGFSCKADTPRRRAAAYHTELQLNLKQEAASLKKTQSWDATFHFNVQVHSLRLIGGKRSGVIIFGYGRGS